MSENVLDSSVEPVNRCPICNSERFAPLYFAADWTFGSGDRCWRYQRCAECGSLFLGPRPSSEHIHLAYRNYYTHADNIGNGTWKGRIVRRLMMRYLDSVRKPGILGALERLFFRAIFPVKEFLDARTRHIAHLNPGAALDFGCGNGEFIGLAENLGWVVRGYDLDPDAVKCSKSRGLDVRLGGVNVLSAEPAEHYDLITLSHVVEHVYDPNHLLKECFRLLKPGGSIWIETPNSRSVGLRLYGRYWRGLEAPRHLCLFAHEGIMHALETVGFRAAQVRRHSLASLYMSVASERILAVAKSKRGSGRRLGWFFLGRAMLFALISEFAQVLWPRKGEFITVIAKK